MSVGDEAHMDASPFTAALDRMAMTGEPAGKAMHEVLREREAYERGLRDGREQERRSHLCPMDIGPALDQSCKEAMETGRHEGLELAAQRAGLGYAAGEECDDIARDIRALGDGKLEGATVWLAEDWRSAGAREERRQLKELLHGYETASYSADWQECARALLRELAHRDCDAEVG